VPEAATAAVAEVRTYEWLIEQPPPDVAVGRRGDAGTADLRDQALRKRHNDYASSPRLDLPARPADLLGVVGNLLRDAVAPDAPGGTPAVDAYLLADVASTGVFKYDDLRHELIATRADGPPLADTLAGTDLAGQRPDAVLVLVAAVGRLYGECDLAAFRAAHVAAGVAYGRLLTVAGAAGVRPVPASSWDGRLAELLELRTEQEVVAAVVALERVGDADAAHQ
jgi:hypothetical protein